MPMLSDITLAFVLAHVLADYHLQNQSLARRKATGTRAMLWHGGIVAALALLAAMLLIWRGGDWALLAIAAAMALLHLVVDIIKRAASGALRKREQNRSPTAHAALYVADQALHLRSYWRWWRACTCAAWAFRQSRPAIDIFCRGPCCWR